MQRIAKSKINPAHRWIFLGEDIDLFVEAHPRLENKKRILLRLYPALLLLFIFGVLKISYFYLIQKKDNSDKKYPDHFVLEANEGHMNENYYKFFNPQGDVPYTAIKAVNKISFTGIHKIYFSKLFKTLIQSLREFKKSSEYLSPKFFNLIYLKAQQSISAYTYWFALFERINKDNPNAKVFSAGQHMPSCAATCLGIETIYISHGLIKRFLSNPAYTDIMIYSEDEQIEYQSYLGHGQVTLFPISEISGLNKSIIIFLAASDNEMSSDNLSDVIKFFSGEGYKIIVKTHPYNPDSKILKQLSKLYKIETNSIKTLAGMQAIKSYKPQFSVGWSSTSLCESLRSGVISINLSSSNEIKQQRSIYPMERRNFCWSYEKDLIEYSAIDSEKYNESLELLRLR
ncbi:hypothetical protein N9Q01_02325 [Gammaproteobacteria bacterium]|nr:hypothetical protein [Gammaproteobacteria bacterium]